MTDFILYSYRLSQSKRQTKQNMVQSGLLTNIRIFHYLEFGRMREVTLSTNALAVYPQVGHTCECEED